MNEFEHILIIGSGAREAVIAKKLLEDSEKYHNKNKKKRLKITCIGTNRNPFLCEKTDLITFSVYDDIVVLLLRLQQIKQKIDFAIIGPEAPLEFHV